MNQADAILSTIRYATISTTDENSKAWAAPVWYVVDGERTLYWWSSLTAQHSKNIERDNTVYITIFDSTAPEGDGLGLYIRAVAGIVHGEQLNKAIELYNSATTQFKVSRDNTTGSAPTRLYQAKPITIQINDGVEIGGFYQDVRHDIS